MAASADAGATAAAPSLETTFLAFCEAVKRGSTTATDKTIKRMLTDCNVYCKGMDANRVDIEFRGFVGNNKKDVDYKGFLEFLESRLAKAYASAKGIEHDVAVQELKDKLAGASPQLHGATKASSDAATARLTDVRNYTGAHKERFDPSTGKGKGKLGREDAPPAFTAAGISAPRK
uniref:Tubulin polymerization-promoting protein n=1 Tax=Schistocephalus solidus TaxID=70667 RepID=A0A0X3PBZ7_SCHSO